MGKTILVISDTHGNREMLNRVIDICYPFDIIIHCGDGIKDICSAEIPGNSDVMMVLGNTDFYSGCDAEDILKEEISGRTVMITHGHQFEVKNSLRHLMKEAKNHDAGVVLFGHTHEQLIREGNPLLFNPGNLSDGSYGIIYASTDREWIFEHRKIRKE